MRLDREFIRLPLTFDAGRLALEIAALDDAAWRPHPQGFRGNSALALIAAGGDPASDAVKGAMLPTPHLQRCPYLLQVLSSFRAVWGRTRLMRLDGNAEATTHVDTNYYWTQRMRVHVPIVTHPDVTFVCGDARVHMAAGESWIFDTWRRHNVLNPRPTRRIHLVADTIGSAAFTELVDAGRHGATARHVAFDPAAPAPLATETFNFSAVMPPSELSEMIELILDSTGASQNEPLRAILIALRADWRAAWARFGDHSDGRPLYRQLLQRAELGLASIDAGISLRSGTNAIDAIRNVVLRPALDDSAPLAQAPTPRATPRTHALERPVFVVCSPRSGSSLFFETMAQSPTLWTIGGESHALIEQISPLHPSQRRFHSNRLTAADATPEVIEKLESAFVRKLRNREGAAPAAAATGLRLLEKTPKNALRVPFLAAAFPDALFVYLYRDMRDTISSMLDAWRSGKFVTYPKLPGWDGPPWSLLLTPGWRELSGKTLPEIVAAQWSTTTRYLLDDLEALGPGRWCVARYDALVAEPQQEMERIAAFIDAKWDRKLEVALPLSRHTLTAPDREKWRHNASDLDIALPLVTEVAERARALFAAPPEPVPQRVSRPAEITTTSAPAASGELRSVHTDSFAELLHRASASLLVSTYQTGRLMALRTNGGALNTHFRAFASPMGIATRGTDLLLGTNQYVWKFRQHPGLARATAPVDAMYVPVSAHATGDIRIHELAFAGDELVIVNTRFSCLARLDDSASFTPIWKPSFITELQPEDRCHLNGVAIIDGRVRYVTALGESNDKHGWRARKADGGIVIDVERNEVLTRGLSMPHSPRWHEGRLWVLESGEGRLCTIDPSTGSRDVIGEVPGFARGLAFAGPYAFIGLSQVRESVFDGIPIARRGDRSCGIWIVDTRNGRSAGFVRFEGIVQEIFDVQLLPGIHWPDFLEPHDERVGATFFLGRTQAGVP